CALPILETYVEKFTNMRFEPSGMTDDPDIRMAQSVVDYIFRRLALDHLPFESRSALGIYTVAERTQQIETGEYAPVDDVDVNDLRQTPQPRSAPKLRRQRRSRHRLTRTRPRNCSKRSRAPARTLRCASRVARRCARPAVVTSAKAVAPPAAAAEVSTEKR